MKTEHTNKWLRFFYLFLTGCFVGWLYEVALGFLYGHGFVNRGFLFGPYLPVYGFGLLLLHLMLNHLMKTPIKFKGIKINPLLVFLGIIVITTVLEYIVGYALLQILGKRFWDYSTYWMNYQGIISFNTSLRFGIGGMFLLYVLVPLTDKLLDKINLTTLKVVRAVVLTVMIIDFITTLLFV